MNLEKVIFSFFMILALTLNFGFFYGEVDNPNHHNVYELFAVIADGCNAASNKFRCCRATGIGSHGMDICSTYS